MTDDAGERMEDGPLKPTLQEPDVPLDAALRPACLADFVGQKTLKENLNIFVEAARKRKAAIDHILFCGPPGLGKTTLALIIAKELGVEVHTTSGPAIEHKGVLAGLLTQLSERAVLFIDEIHRLRPAVEEYLYPAMEDLALDVPSGAGAFAQTLRLNLKPFTLVGATTRSGMLTSPLRDRFGIVQRLGHYEDEDLVKIVLRSAGLLELQIEPDAAEEIGRRSRGTPRIVNRLLRRVRDFADVEGDGSIDIAIAKRGLSALGIDDQGLDQHDRSLLKMIVERHQGGPVGIDALAAALHEEADTLENEVEPYLIQQGFIQRTPRGRMAMARAYTHLGLDVPADGPQGNLF